MEFANQVVLVTGAGGRIGGAICREFARAGAKVACCDLNPPRAEATAEGRRIAEGFAGRLQLPVHELSALESAPEAGDYLSVMRENLDALREGLECI